MKIHPVVAEMLHAHGRTDVHGEANIRFSQFCASSYKVWKICSAMRIMGDHPPAVDIK